MLRRGCLPATDHGPCRSHRRAASHGDGRRLWRSPTRAVSACPDSRRRPVNPVSEDTGLAGRCRELLDQHVPAGEHVAVVADPAVLPFEALGRPVVGLQPDATGSAAAVARLEAQRVQGRSLPAPPRTRPFGNRAGRAAGRASWRAVPGDRPGPSGRGGLRGLGAQRRRGGAHGARGADRWPRLGRPLGTDTRLDVTWAGARSSAGSNPLPAGRARCRRAPVSGPHDRRSARRRRRAHGRGSTRGRRRGRARNP